jgi:hypothetical protein
MVDVGDSARVLWLFEFGRGGEGVWVSGQYEQVVGRWLSISGLWLISYGRGISTLGARSSFFFYNVTTSSLSCI